MLLLSWKWILGWFAVNLRFLEISIVGLSKHDDENWIWNDDIDPLYETVLLSFVSVEQNDPKFIFVID